MAPTRASKTPPPFEKSAQEDLQRRVETRAHLVDLLHFHRKEHPVGGERSQHDIELDNRLRDAVGLLGLGRI